MENVSPIVFCNAGAICKCTKNLHLHGYYSIKILIKIE